MKAKKCMETLVRDGFILVFNQDKLDVVKTAEALLKAGIHNMEVTCRIQTPLSKIERLRKELSEFVVGAASLIDCPGTLKAYNEAHADDPLPSVKEAANSGAQYLVSAANFRAKSYEKFAGKLAMIPGCGTASEIIQQFDMGANLCKIFPAQQLGGPAFVKAIDPAIHKLISLVPTGGTNSENIPDYIAAGILVLGGSFSMIENATLQQIIDEQNYEWLREEFKKVKEQINTLRGQQWPDLDFSNASLKEISQATGRNFNL
jgi:2-dehydro-3-deoxyphosphogluconate aldolase / (4S)-4-hydroxy-2-oxoglutarate aldolase